MSEINAALENLTDAYAGRGRHEAALRAKYANFQRELEAAKARDVDEVAQALVAAWNTGASVASTGRAMGTNNIYASRRTYYQRARAIQGETEPAEAEFLDALYLRARGEVDAPVVQESETPEPEDTVEISTDEEWVRSWTLTQIDDDTWSVDDPQERVASINVGRISGFPEKNIGEFLQDAALHEILYRIHPETSPNKEA